MSRTLILLVSLITFYLSSQSFAQEKTDKVHLGIIYPLSTHGKNAQQYNNTFSLHLLAGLSNAEEGFSFAGLTNKVKQNVTGAHIAGLAYFTGNKTEGLQFSGLLNTYKEGKGV